MHLKIQNIPKSWPTKRKGKRYVVVASHDKNSGIPLLIIIRDLLKLAENRKEVKKILNSGEVSVNGKKRKEEKLSVLPGDIINIGNKIYHLSFSEKGKLIVEETKNLDKVFKIINKTLIKNKKIQLNLSQGKNILLDKDEKLKTGDSIILKDNKISKIIPLEKGREVLLIKGKNKGKQGKIEEINEGTATISLKDKKIEIPTKHLIVIK